MEKKYKAEDVMEIVKNLENEERWKFLDLMFDEFFNTGNVPKTEDLTDY